MCPVLVRYAVSFLWPLSFSPLLQVLPPIVMLSCPHHHQPEVDGIRPRRGCLVHTTRVDGRSLKTGRQRRREASPTLHSGAAAAPRPRGPLPRGCHRHALLRRVRRHPGGALAGDLCSTPQN